MDTPLAFGGNPRPTDERDFKLGAYQIPIAIPAAFTNDMSPIPVKNQGQYGSCGAHAGAAFDSALQTNKRGTVQDLAPKFLWRQIKHIDGYGLNDGTDIRSIMKALQGPGDCTEASSPNTLDPTIEQYSNYGAITPKQTTEGVQNKIGNYAFIDYPNFDQIKQAIYQNKVVIGLIQVSDAFWKPSWTDPTLFPLKFTTLVSGHFVVFYGYDEKYIYFRNSWSEAWGLKGNGYFDESYSKHVIDLGVALTLPAPYIFVHDLNKGVTSKDVKELQKRMNANPATQIAAAGPGSAGHETEFFGDLTLAAVKKYQKLNGVPDTGFVGPLTRVQLNTTA